MRALDEELARFVPGGVLLTDHPDHPEVTLASVQSHKDGLLIGIVGISDRTVAAAMQGTSLLVAERRVLENDEFWPEQLTGIAVVDPNGGRLGVVSGIVAGDAQDRIVVTTADGDFEVPFVAALFPTVDLEAGSMVLDAPEGLLDS